MRILALAASLLLLGQRAGAGPFSSSEAGTSGGAFLKLGADARAAGMGGAVRAAVDDASAVYWNPAGLAGLRERHATVTHGASYQSTFLDFAAYAHPIEPRFGRDESRERALPPEPIGTIAVAALYQNSGRLTEVDNAAAPTGNSLTPQDMALLIGWGSALADGWEAGAALKYVSSKIQHSAETGAVDLGARWRTRVGEQARYAVSVSAHHLGGQLKFHDEGDPLPMTVVLGQAFQPTQALTLTCDVSAPRDRALYPSLGAEWRAAMPQGLAGALRAGYDGRLRSSDVGGLAGLAIGAGLGARRVAFDYAWSPAGELGDSHKLSLSYRF